MYQSDISLLFEILLINTNLVNISVYILQRDNKLMKNSRITISMIFEAEITRPKSLLCFQTFLIGESTRT